MSDNWTREQRKRYNKEYYKKHKEEIRQSHKEYYEGNKKYFSSKNKKFRLKNLEGLKKYRKRWYKKNKEEEKRKQKYKYRKELKLEILMHYGGSPPKCACCGENHIEFLTIDHVNGREKGDKKTGGTLQYWIKRNNFPKGFQVLCFNCNCAKGFFGECPHKREKR